MAAPPWSSGPGEILQHGLELLRRDTDSHRRLAMLSIDNAVELTIKTFLGLPKRVTGLSIGRRKYSEISESFPKLLDALEEHASGRINGVDLGEIEWYHRLRNQLYHQGNGLTVEREKVEVYAGLAKVLFEQLFGHELEVKGSDDAELLGRFLRSWVGLEQVLLAWASKLRRKTMSRPAPSDATRRLATRKLVGLRVIEEGVAREIDELRATRNRWVHAPGDDPKEMPAIQEEMIERIEEITKTLGDHLADPGE